MTFGSLPVKRCFCADGERWVKTGHTRARRLRDGVEIEWLACWEVTA